MAQIFAADDDPDIGSLVSYILTEEGHEVRVFTDGVSIRSAALAGSPDLMILDIAMPELDGYQVLDTLKRWRSRSHTRILVLTSRASELDWSRAYNLGADRFMTKPFDPDELVTTVNELLAIDARDLEEFKSRERDKAQLLSQIEHLFGE